MKKCISCGKNVSSAKMRFCPDCGGELAEIRENGNKAPAPVGEATGFCTYCGTRFNEFGVCAQCGNLSSRQSKALSKPEPYGKKLLECMRGLFSASPFNGIENAGRETASTVWPICAGGFVLFVSLALTGIMTRTLIADTNGLKLMPEKITMGIFFGQGRTFFATLLRLLITAAAVFFSSSALLWLPMRRSGEKVSYVQLMNVNSFALLPVTLTAAVSFVLSFFVPSAAMFLLPVGAFMSVILLYYAVQKIARFKASPFWSFAGALLGSSVICYLCMYVLGKLFA